MTLKGNLEVLNLSDIFQSLSLNQHTGTLRVTDGKREKLVHFAQGEITLLASEKKVKIGEMLVASGKISAEDLDYALQQQKKSKKKLGEILVEEGFVSEDDIADIVRQQIEAEIYDLFLWKKADFEFLIDYVPEKLKNPTHGITKLQFNTSSLIMEALRRLDEWSVISKEIPTLKEVYKVVNTNPAALEEIDLPERVKAEIRLIDGERSIEAVSEETSLSEFELCKLIFELKSRGIVAPLTPQELSDRADEAFQKGKFRQASALYDRLVETLPKNLSIRWHLAESLKAFGDEQRALEQYVHIAETLEGTRDRQELAKAYRAILDLAADRRDILEKLRALDKAKWQRTALKTTVMIVLAVGLVGGGVYGLMRAGKLGPLKDKIVAMFKSRGGEDPGDPKVAERRARELLNGMEDALRANDPARAFELGMKIVRDFPKTTAREEVRLPITVRSDPSERVVYLDGVEKGKTDAILAYAPKAPGEKLKVEIRDGARVVRTEEVDAARYHDLSYDLFKKPVWTVHAEAPIRCAPVFRDRVAYFASMDGKLHGRVIDDDQNSPQLAIPLSDVPGGSLFGTALGGLAIAEDVLVYGTIDGDVKGYNLSTRQRALNMHVSDQPILSAPAVAAGGAIVVVAGYDGGINLIDVRRQARIADTMLTANRITADPVEASGLVFVASRDNRLLAIEPTQATILWSRSGRGDYAARAQPVGEYIVAGDVTGEVACMDRKSGALIWISQAPGSIVGLAADETAVYATTRQGDLVGFQVGTGRPIWPKVATPKHPGRPAVVGGVVVVGGDTGLTGYDREAGKEIWSARTKAPLRGHPAVYEGRVYIGSEEGALHAFEPN